MNDNGPHIAQRVIVYWVSAREHEVGDVIDLYGPEDVPRAVVRTDSGRKWAGMATAVIDATVPDDISSLVEGR